MPIFNPNSAIREQVAPGAVIDGYRIGECIHKGGTSAIYQAFPPEGHDPGFPIVIKTPFLGRGESAIGIDSFEVEQMILPALTGRHVPAFVAAGDVTATPYIVMEKIEGDSLDAFVARAPLPAQEVARIGAALADAVQSVHAQEVIHHDIKPQNFMLRTTGEAVLLDFGFARHDRYPDLLAEAKHFAAGTAAYVSPEQLQDDRTDPRSDLFALGAVLYELATGEQPFGRPRTLTGLRDRLWREPVPPRALKADVPPWLQEVILRCLEPDAEQRYQAAAHIALDLKNPDQIALSERAERNKGAGFMRHVSRWWRAHRNHDAHEKRPPNAANAPVVVMVAIDTEHPDDERHSPLQWTTRQIVSLNADIRLMCVSVIRSVPVGEGPRDIDTTTGKHLEHRTRLRHWVAPLNLPPSRVSLHVVEAFNAADTLLDLARTNHVDLIVLGAPGASSKKPFGWWRSAASTVTANAPCSVHVVRVPERNVQASLAAASRESVGLV